MKKGKNFAAYVLAGSALLTTNNSFAEETAGQLTANVGFASEYFYRGILQKESSGSAGLDYEYGAFSVGTWAADVGDGLEVDVYGAYTMNVEDFSFSVGFTGYYYTGEFDDTYEEINLGAGWKGLSVGYSVGTYDNFDGPEQDYDFAEVSYEFESGFYGRYATFGDDFDGDFIEVGYGTEIGGFDVSAFAIFNSDELSDQLDSKGRPTEGEALIFTIGKTFDL